MLTSASYLQEGAAILDKKAYCAGAGWLKPSPLPVLHFWNWKDLIFTDSPRKVKKDLQELDQLAHSLSSRFLSTI